MNYLLSLQKINTDIKSLDIQPIINSDSKIVGWNCYFMNHLNQAIAGGTSSNKDIAVRIAVAECYERSLFNQININTAQHSELLLNESPSTSGFAAGFEKESTAFRSLCEGIERWAWSKWIDEGFYIEKKVINNLNELSIHMISEFSKCNYYQTPIKISHPFSNTDLVFSVFLGFKKNGVFAGSRVTNKLDNPWEHAIIESYRNLKNFELSNRNQIDNNNLIGQRAYYFGSHSSEALLQIMNAKKIEWPAAKLRIHKEIQTNIDSIYLFRSICFDFKYWHLGDEKRFVY